MTGTIRDHDDKCWHDGSHLAPPPAVTTPRNQLEEPTRNSHRRHLCHTRNQTFTRRLLALQCNHGQQPQGPVDQCALHTLSGVQSSTPISTPSEESQRGRSKVSGTVHRRSQTTALPTEWMGVKSPSGTPGNVHCTFPPGRSHSSAWGNPVPLHFRKTQSSRQVPTNLRRQMGVVTRMEKVQETSAHVETGPQKIRS